MRWAGWVYKGELLPNSEAFLSLCERTALDLESEGRRQAGARGSRGREVATVSGGLELWWTIWWSGVCEPVRRFWFVFLLFLRAPLVNSHEDDECDLVVLMGL